MKPTLLFLSVFLSASLFGQQMTYVPDDYFEGKLIDFGLDDVFDDSVLTSNVSGLIDLDLSSSFISDLTGVEAFMSLETLSVSQNLLTTIDVSQLTSLSWLECGANQLTNLDVSQNPALVLLSCGSNEITNLDVSQNILLEDLRCNSNLLTSLNIGQNTALQLLDCQLNELTSLDISNNVGLTAIYFQYNALECLNLKNGNNVNMGIQNSLSQSASNPGLTCIEVDDANWSAANWTNVNTQTFFSEDCNNDCSTSTVGINELTTSKNLIQILDMMGRETSFKPNTPLIYVYDDGSTEKVFSVEY